MSERVPKPTRREIEIEVSPFTDQYVPTWLAIWDAQSVLNLVTQELHGEGMEFFATWRGHPTHAPEVRDLVSQSGEAFEPPFDHKHRHVPINIASVAVAEARLNEIDRLEQLISYDDVTSAALLRHIARRRKDITAVASRPPEGKKQ